MVHILLSVICAVLLCLPPTLATSSCVEDLHFLMHGQQWTWHDMRGVNSSFGPLNETLYPAALDHYITVTTVNTGLGWCGAFPKGVVTFHLRPDSSDMAVWKEIWLWHEFQILDEAVLPGGPVKRVVDLGGNVGLAALYFATRFSGSEVVVVEPSIDNFGALTMNVAAHTNVFVERAAAAATDGFSLFLDPGLGHWGYRTTALQGHMRTSPQGYHTQTTPSLSVESLLHKYHWDGVDYMKIDIEGGELALCRQMKRGAWWPTVVRCMSFEFHDRFGGKFANSSTYCKTALSAAGFQHKGTYKELEVFCQH